MSELGIPFGQRRGKRETNVWQPSVIENCARNELLIQQNWLTILASLWKKMCEWKDSAFVAIVGALKINNIDFSRLLVTTQNQHDQRTWLIKIIHTFFLLFNLQLANKEGSRLNYSNYWDVQRLTTVCVYSTCRHVWKYLSFEQCIAGANVALGDAESYPG